MRGLREKYGVEVYLEPGEAVVLNAGFLVTSVLETMENGMQIAILDTSAARHMPDVLEMPYRPPLIGAGEAGEKPYTFRLGGPTCLSGDCIGDYSFDAPLKRGRTAGVWRYGALYDGQKIIPLMECRFRRSYTGMKMGQRKWCGRLDMRILWDGCKSGGEPRDCIFNKKSKMKRLAERLQ